MENRNTVTSERRVRVTTDNSQWQRNNEAHPPTNQTEQIHDENVTQNPGTDHREQAPVGNVANAPATK